MPRDEIGKDAIAAAEGKGRRGGGGVTGISKRMIVGKKQGADKKKTDELSQNDRAARKQSQGRAARFVGTEITLNEILIRSVRRHRQKTAAEKS